MSSKDSACELMEDLRVNINKLSSATSRSCSRSNVSSPSSSRSIRLITPRRVFPQTYNANNVLDINELTALDDSSVIFDGKMSFVFGSSNQQVHQEIKPTPAYVNPKMSSNYLSTKVDSFLKRTDHVEQEWKAIWRQNNDQNKNISETGANSKSSITNIMVKGFQVSASLPPLTPIISNNKQLYKNTGNIIEVCKA